MKTPSGRPKQRPPTRFSMRLMTFFARRFVAGEDAASAIEAARNLNARGIRASLDYLGEEVYDAAQASAALAEYQNLLRAIREAGVDANISIKLTQLGLAFDRDLAAKNLSALLEEAKTCGLWVRIDMESSAYTQATLELFSDALKTHGNVGIVIQAGLRRSARDIEDLMGQGARVRLCKGAYKEPEEKAFQSKAEVNASFDSLAVRLLESENEVAIATHDDDRIDAVRQRVKETAKDPKGFEFQMLYGLRRRLWDRLIGEGWNLRIYVPYGDAWMPYMLRRLRERKENWMFVLRSLWRG